MNTNTRNEDTKKGNVRIAVGDLDAKADVRGGLTTTLSTAKLVTKKSYSTATTELVDTGLEKETGV